MKDCISYISCSMLSTTYTYYKKWKIKCQYSYKLFSPFFFSTRNSYNGLLLSMDNVISCRELRTFFQHVLLTLSTILNNISMSHLTQNIHQMVWMCFIYKYSNQISGGRLDNYSFPLLKKKDTTIHNALQF